MLPSLSHRTGVFNSAVMSWRAGTVHPPEATAEDRRSCRLGDQEFLWKHCNPVPFPRGHAYSYKRDVRNTEIPKGASIVMFHGYPMPHEVSDPRILASWGSL